MKASGDPWGLAYKLACQTPNATAISFIQEENGLTIDWRDTANIFWIVFFPENKEEEDDFDQRRLREQMYELGPVDRQETPFSGEEIGAVLRKMKSKKASG